MNRNWPATDPTHEDVTPDRGFSALRLAVPRLQVASEHTDLYRKKLFSTRACCR